MSAYEAQSYAGDFLGWRAEVVARMRDILSRKLSRKALPASERIAEKFTALVHRLESALPTMQFKTVVKDLLTSLRRERAVDVEEALDQEIEALHSRIRAYRAKESIENYSAFLFTIDVKI